jgi:hypothetical protein
VQRSPTSTDNPDSGREFEQPRGTLPADPLQARVDAAAFALLRDGRNPTVSLVRARMGGASPNAVAPALQRWRLTFAAQLGENAGSALEVLPPGVLELVQALWSRALFEAHRVRADARSTADALEQLDEAIKALRERAARLEAREAALDEERRDLDRLRQQLQETATAPRARSRSKKSAPPVRQAVARRKTGNTRRARQKPAASRRPRAPARRPKPRR